MNSRLKTTLALICVLLLIVLAYIVGARAGLKDGETKTTDAYKNVIASMKADYQNQIDELNAELEIEKQIEHIEIEYVPMPVDYEVELEAPLNDIALLAQMGIGEDTMIDLHPERVAATYETVFNRVDNPDPYFPDTIAGVIKQPNAYQGWSADKPVDERYFKLALDCWYRWQISKLGISDPGLVIPENCLSFAGDGEKNTFRLTDGSEWKFTMRNPYKELELK